MDIDKTRKKILRVRQCYTTVQMYLDDLADALKELEQIPEIKKEEESQWLKLGQEILRRTLP